MSSASSTTTVTIASLNVACARRDEDKCSLASRLPAIQNFLSAAVKEHSIDILCIQEIRETGDHAVGDIISAIVVALGKGWSVTSAVVNKLPRSFYRATFYKSEAVTHVVGTTMKTENTDEKGKDSLIKCDVFCVESDIRYDPFQVINVHAPMRLPDKEEYWKQAALLGGLKRSVIIGDMNKFPEDHEVYKKYFQNAYLEDKVGLEKTTFVSFPWDSKPDGTPWTSCLDAFITHPSIKTEITVVSTHEGFDATLKDKDKLRPSDHFLVIGKINLDKKL